MYSSGMTPSMKFKYANLKQVYQKIMGLWIWVIPPSWATKCDILLLKQALYFYNTTYTIVTSCLTTCNIWCFHKVNEKHRQVVQGRIFEIFTKQGSGRTENRFPVTSATHIFELYLHIRTEYYDN